MGTLSYLTGTTAIFLQGSKEITFRISVDLFRKLAQQGVGSQWEYGTCDDPQKFANLQWVSYRGMSPELRSGLDALSQYLRQGTCSPGRDLARPTGPFPGKEPPGFRTNWQLTEIDAIKINVSVHYAGYSDGESGAVPPWTENFSIYRNGSRWTVKPVR